MSEMQATEPVAIFVATKGLRAPYVQLPHDLAVEKAEGDRPLVVKFADGRHECHDADVANAMRAHKACRDNNKPGEKVFFELGRNVRQHGNDLAGFKTAIQPEGGLTDEDTELLRAIQANIEAARLPPPAVKKAVERFQLASARFNVSGLTAPTVNDKPDKVQVRLEDLMKLLADNGIEP